MKSLRLLLPLGIFTLPLFFLVKFNNQSFTDFINKSNYKVIEQIEGKNTYHMQSPSELYNGWTCGLFTLFNAYKIEQDLGLTNKVEFKKVCENYLKPKKVDPFDGTYADDLVNIADQHLKLHNYYGLYLNQNGQIEPLSDVSIKWNLSSKNKDIHFEVDAKSTELNIQGFAPYKTDKSKLNKLFNEEKNKQLQGILQNLKAELDAVPAHKSHVIHFLCEIPEHVHWILISVVKKPYEKPVLFVFDNMNYKISTVKSTQKYIEQINQMYCA
ncbi:iron transporter [Candidatus Dependentiae bacterium]|nr:iron transporter [Candidatus Dependentiae bacterium]